MNLIFNKSVGPYILGSPISNYLFDDIEFEFLKANGSDDWDCYRNKNDKFDIYIEEGLIISISCEKTCFYEGVNIIGIMIMELTKLIGEFPNLNITDAFEMHSDNTVQIVYEFDKWGIQVWTKKGKIVNIFCSYDDEK